ncbi:hypothetical protein [Duganella sp. CY15W]
MRGIPLHEASYFGHADVLRVLVALPDRRIRCYWLQVQSVASAPADGC